VAWLVGLRVAGCGLLAGRPVESGGVGRLGRGATAITWGEAVAKSDQAGPSKCK
jgi:hypothetical protein